MVCGQSLAMQYYFFFSFLERKGSRIYAQTVSKLYICSTLFIWNIFSRISTDNKSSIVFLPSQRNKILEECCREREREIRSGWYPRALRGDDWTEFKTPAYMTMRDFFFPVRVLVVFCLLPFCFFTQREIEAAVAYKTLSLLKVREREGGIEKVIIDVYWGRQWWLPSGGVCLFVRKNCLHLAFCCCRASTD